MNIYCMETSINSIHTIVQQPSLLSKSHVSNQRVTEEAIAMSITINSNNKFNDKNILSLTIFDYKLIHNSNTLITKTLP